MPRIKDLSNYTGALNRSDIFFVVDGNSFSRGMSLSGQQVFTMCKGIDGKNIELRATASFIQWRQEGDTSWANLISVSELKGADGKELEIRAQAGYIQTRLTGGTWSNLIELTDLKGDKGDPADNPNLTFVISALAWDAAPTANVTGVYPDLTVSLGIPKGKDASLPVFTFNISALEWNETPTASVSGTYPNLIVALGIPKGKDAALPVFTTNAIKGNPGENPEVSVSGDYPNIELQFKIPAGERGLQGKPLVVLPNGNYGNWDEDLQSYVDSGVEASATVDLENVPVNFTEAATRETINTGETVPTVFGKLKKWFSDLGALAWKTKVDYQNDIDNLPTLLTSTDINNAVNTHNTSDIAHNDIRVAVNNKVDKEGSKVLSDNNFSDTYKNAVDNNSTQIQALLGAVVYLGNIANTTAELEAASGQTLLTNKANEIIAEQSRPIPLQKGDTLVDSNNNDWWYDGNLWINIGYTAVSTATNTALGVVKGSTENFKISIDVDGVMSVNGIQSVDKTATIQVANWVLQGDSTYNAIIYDTDILEDSKVSVMPADSASLEVYAETEVFAGTSSAGQLLLRAKNAPSNVININYSIEI